MFTVRRLLFFVVALVATSSLTLSAATPEPASEAVRRRVAAMGELPIWFEENRGQYGCDVDYAAKVRNDLLEISATSHYVSSMDGGSRLGMHVVGARPRPAEPDEPLPTRVSYFLDNDRSKWVHGAKTFRRLTYRAIYPGIDLVYHGTDENLEYDFVVAPKSDPDRIRLTFSGASSLRIDANGDLVITSAKGEVRHHAPRAYQNKPSGRVDVKTAFRLRNGVVSFEVGKYDRRLPLVIDPVLSFSRFLFSGMYNNVRSVKVDGAGNIYVSGVALTFTSANFGFSGGATMCWYVAKYDPSGTTAAFVTYIGADWNFSSPSAMAVDTSGNVYIVGGTHYMTFPTTPGAFEEFPSQRAYTSSTEDKVGVVIKVHASGTSLVYSSFLGNAELRDVVADAAGNAYVTGRPTGRTTPGAYQQSGATVAKINPNGTALVYATGLGGIFSDGAQIGTSIDVDASGNVVVAGFASQNLPTTAGALIPSYTNSTTGSFVTKLNATGTAALFSTYFYGGVVDLEIAPSNQIYLFGQINTGANFPATAGAFDTTPSSFGDMFVAVLDSSGGAMPYGTFLGGSNGDDAFSMALDPTGNVVVAANARSVDIPLVDAIQGVLFPNQGNAGWYLARLTPTLSNLQFATHFGPTNFGVWCDVMPGGDIVFAGNGPPGMWIRNFPIPQGLWTSEYENTEHSILGRISFSGSMPPFAIDTRYPSGGPNDSSDQITFRGTGIQPGATVLVDGVPLTDTLSVSADGTYAYISRRALPGNAVATKTLSIQNPGGAIASVPGTYAFKERPRLTSVTPNHGTADGGEEITIVGSGFDPLARVEIGGHPCVITQTGPTQLKCLTPVRTQSVSSDNLRVLNPEEENAGTSWHWDDGLVPTVTSVTPAEGGVAGGETLTITGTNFHGLSRVLIGDYWSHDVTVNSATQITAVTPPNVPGTHRVRVARPSQAVGDLENAFTVRGIMSVTPFDGVVSGGTVVEVIGRGFASGDSVFFDGVPATNVTFNSSTSLTVTTPAHAAGWSVVTVTGAHETYEKKFGFFYREHQPTITAITPNTGLATGGETVTITGTFFLAGATVKFGGVAAPSVTVQDANTLSVVTPAQSGGIFNVTVTNYDGQSVTLTNGFTFRGISTITPSEGRQGDVVSVRGAGFQSGASVTFDGVASPSVTLIQTGVWLTAQVPAHAPGFVNVAVINPGPGGETYTKANGFRYLLPAHTVTAVSPSNGPQAGGTTITITGTNFVAGSTVKVGSVAATDVAFVDATTITAKTPPQAPGTYSVSVTLPDNQTASKANAFSYNGTPSISSVNPNTGPPAGGTNVTISGALFQPGATITFGGIAATNVAFVNAGQLTCTTPAHALGPVDVVVQNPDTQSATSANGFRYVGPPPTITSFTPGNGPPGTAVTITGTNFDQILQIRFNTTVAPAYTVNSLTEIVATVPNGATTGPIHVQAAAGTATSATNFTVDSLAPSITSFTPTAGGAGTAVTISGARFTGATSVTFNNVSAVFSVMNDTTINATAPPAVSDGLIRVTTPNGTGASALPFTVGTSPAVTSFTPTKGTPGTSVAITGKNFTTASAVRFNGLLASFTINSDTSITAIVPQGTQNGPIAVTNVDGTGQSATNFATPSVLSSFAPSAGSPGSTIVITGSNFVGSTGVTFNGVTAAFVVQAPDRIAATVPASATNGVITVAAPYGPTSSSYPFTVLLPNTPTIVATATGATTVSLVWTGDPTRSYDVTRVTSKYQYGSSPIARVTGTSFTDGGLTPGTSYLYRVTDLTSGLVSNNDYATTIVFTDDPLVGGTVIKTAHLVELRQAVNAMRVVAGLAPVSWTDPNPAGLRVRAVHIGELRSALRQALVDLSRYADFTDPGLDTGYFIRGFHIRELREAVK